MASSIDELEARLKNYYNESNPYFAEMASHDSAYFITYLKLVTRFADRIADSNHKLLELGCANGFSTRLIAEHLPAYECTGVDLSERAVRAARAANSGPRLEFESADCCALPFADGTFAIVTSCDMLEHVPQPGRALREMVRVVRPGGVVIIKGPHLGNPLVPLLDLLTFRSRYPFTRRWLDNFPRLLALGTDFARKAVRREVRFNIRSPDLSDSVRVGDDADAVYEQCVLDLINFFRQAGFRLLQIAQPRHDSPTSRAYTRLLPYFASVGIVAQEPLEADPSG